MQGPVICGIDDSREAEGAVEVAREVAERYGLPLVYVRVRGERLDGEEATLLSQTATSHEDGELVVDAGHPTDRLVALAEEREASFLVLGNRGPRSSLLGSVSAEVARRAPCPVIVVPPTARLRDAPVGDPGPAVLGGILRFGPGGRSAA